MNQSPAPVNGDGISRDVEVIQQMEVVPELLRMVCQQTGLGCAVVARVTEHDWTACAVEDRIGLGLDAGARLNSRITLCNEVRIDRSTLVIERASVDRDYWNVDILRRHGIESYVSVPIIRTDGSYFGNLCAFDQRPPSGLDKRAISLMEGIAHIIVRELERESAMHMTAAALREERSSGGTREEFIAVIGHDLRSPLGAVSASAEALARHPDDAVRDAARRIVRNAHRMTLMIEDLMDMARGRLGGGIHLRPPTAGNLAGRLAEVVQEHRVMHPHRAIVDDIVIGADLHCDWLRLQQVLSNLLANALHHGSPEEPIRVSAVVEEAELVMTVWNSGNPIAPDDQARIFEPYWRPASARSDGLGLGLYICSQIVKAHRGSLSVSSTRETGTCFEARFPALTPAH